MGNTKSKKLQKKQPERLYYIDILNILACLCVISLHCTETAFSYQNTPKWHIAVALRTLTFTAVPVFIMITGITLFDYRQKYDTETFFKKRVLRTLVPFVIWSVIYVIWNAINAGNIFPSPGAFIIGIISCKASGVLWYFYMIFGIYLSIPVLSLIAEKKNEGIIYYYAALCILASALIPLFNYFSPYKLSGSFTIPIASGFISYLIFGYILKIENWKREIRINAYIAGVLSVLLTFFGTVYFSKKSGKLDDVFLGYSSICCMVLSVSYVLFIKRSVKLIQNKNNSAVTPPLVCEIYSHC